MLDALSITEIVIERDGKPCRYDKVKIGEEGPVELKGWYVPELGGVEAQYVYRVPVELPRQSSGSAGQLCD